MNIASERDDERPRNALNAAHCAAVLLLALLPIVPVAAQTVECNSGPPINHAPIANADHYSWPAGQVSLDVLANDSDVDHDPIVITSIAGVTGAAVAPTVQAGMVVFTPDPAASSGGFIYSISDGHGNSSQAVVTLTNDGSGTFSNSCTDIACNFTALPQNSVGIWYYNWDFGDNSGGVLAVSPALSHTFNSVTPGASKTFNVSLNIVYTSGARITATRPVTVSGPAAEVTWVVDLSGGLKTSYRITSSTFPPPTDTIRYRFAFTWPQELHPGTEVICADFSNTCPGFPVNIPVQHTFANAGQQPVEVDVSKESCTKDANGVCGPWQAVCISPQACIANFGTRILNVVNAAPTPKFTVGAVGTGGKTFSFDPAGSQDDTVFQSGAYDFTWDFGDGSYGSSSILGASPQPVTHTYTHPGLYKVSLVINDHQSGLSPSATNSVTVANAAPVAAFGFSCAALTCSVDGTSSTDDELVTSWSWDPGDGSPVVSGAKQTISYRASGCYNVRLTVTDGKGLNAFSGRTLAVSGGPLANASTSPLVVDAHRHDLTTQSNLNGILEPGETVLIEPEQIATGDVAGPPNGSGPLTFGALTGFTGPAGATYQIVDGVASFANVVAGAPTDCWQTGDCYAIGVSSTGARPALHWDAQLQETRPSGTVSWPVHIGASFSDVPPTYYWYPWIETLLHYGITGGCGNGAYCPGDPLARWQAAIFVLGGRARGSYKPSACMTDPFTDVSCTSFYGPYVNDFKTAGITSGCGPGLFCPNDTVDRGAMVTFLTRSLHPAGWTPPPCSQVFDDVTCIPTTASPTKHMFADYISEAYRLGITNGCGPHLFCPGDIVSRGMAAALISNTYHLSIATAQCAPGTAILGSAP